MMTGNDDSHSMLVYLLRLYAVGEMASIGVQTSVTTCSECMNPKIAQDGGFKEVLKLL